MRPLVRRPMRAGQGAAELAFGLYDEPVDHGIGREVVPGLVDFEVAVPRLTPAVG